MLELFDKYQNRGKLTFPSSGSALPYSLVTTCNFLVSGAVTALKDCTFPVHD